MKNYLLVIALLLPVGLCRGSSLGESRARKIGRNLSEKATLGKPALEKSTFKHKYIKELKTHGTAPFFLASLLSLYTSDYLYNRESDHLHSIATSALVAPLAQRFSVYPALEMGRLASHPEAKDQDEFFERLSYSKNSIRPTVTGLGTFMVTSLGLLSLAEKLVGKNPGVLRTTGCLGVGLMIPALLVKIDEWTEESAEMTMQNEKDQSAKKLRVKPN
jgi:hypothetical protein